MKFEKIYTEKAPAPVGAYSQAIETNNMLFTSGQIALDATSGAIIAGGIKEQTKEALKNLKNVLSEAGYRFEHVVKTTIYLKDMNDFPLMNEVYAHVFVKSLPARSTVEVSRLPKDALVEIDCIAVR
jgi:2-iminobutanoate/2-iminopropanoate deaminase